MADEQPILPLIQVTNEEYEKSVKAAQRRNEAKKKKSSKKSSSGGSSGGPFGFLKATNDWLEGVPAQIDAAYENFMGNSEAMSQEEADVICAWLSWKVNIAVERKRQAILKVLYGQYQSTAAGKVMKAATVVKSFLSDPLGTLGSFASLIFGPVPAVLKWVSELAKEVLRLGVNLAAIVSALPPSPISPNINYNKFQLKINSLSMGDVMSDPSSLPPPEVMFPEPQKPFTEDTFAKGFESATASLKSGKKKYKLSEEDKKTLAGFDNKVDTNFTIS